MGFLSSLFGIGGSKPATQQIVQSSRLPEEVAPFAQEVLDEAQVLYKQRLGEGYTPFPGETIAPFTPEQEQALAGIAGLVGTSAPLQEEALAIGRGTAERFTPEVAKEFMSPYQQAVIDVEKREAMRDFEGRILPQFEKQAVSAGGMSGLGTRAGVQAAELGRAQSQRLGDIETKGLQAAFEAARQDFASQKTRERQLSSDLMAAGPTIFKAQAAEQGALQSVGEARQQLGQEALDEAYFRFLEEQQYPQERLAEYSGFVYGNPLLQQRTTTQTQPAPRGPSMGAQLMGLGATAANIYGMGGGFTPQGFTGSNFMSGLNKRFGQKHGGGLSDLPIVRRQTNGRINDPNILGVSPFITGSAAMGRMTVSPEVAKRLAAAEKEQKEELYGDRTREQQEALAARMNRLYELRKKIAERSEKLAPKRGGFLSGFTEEVMKDTPAGQRPPGLLTTGIRGLLSGEKAFQKREKDYLDWKRAALAEEGAAEIADLTLEEDKLENFSNQSYQNKLKIVQGDVETSKLLANIPFKERAAIIKNAKTLADIRLKAAQARDKIAEAAARKATGKYLKPAAFNALVKNVIAPSAGVVYRPSDGAVVDMSGNPLNSLAALGYLVKLMKGVKAHGKPYDTTAWEGSIKKALVSDAKNVLKEWMRRSTELSESAKDDKKVDKIFNKFSRLSMTSETFKAMADEYGEGTVEQEDLANMLYAAKIAN